MQIGFSVKNPGSTQEGHQDKNSKEFQQAFANGFLAGVLNPPKELLANIAKSIASRMQAEDLDIEDLAIMAKVPQQDVEKILKGEQIPIESSLKIAELFFFFDHNPLPTNHSKLVMPCSVQPLPNYQLKIEFEDGYVAIADVSKLKGQGVFLAWETDPALFEQVYLDGGAIAWNDKLMIDALIYHPQNSFEKE